MRVREVGRDVVLVAAAAAVGWWCHGAGMPVHAERGAESYGSLGFQFMPGGDQSSLSIYSEGDHTIYVYPRVGVGNAHIGCEYKFHIRRLGDAIDRENCRPGSALP